MTKAEGVRAGTRVLRPCGARLLVQREEAAQTYGDSAIVIPERDRERKLWGRVVAVGPGTGETWDGVSPPPPAALGDEVLFGKYSGEEIELDGSEYLLLKWDEVLAVLDTDTDVEEGEGPDDG